MPLGERDTVAQVDHPFTGRQPLGDLRGVGRTWRGEVDGSGARGVGRAHVRVVRRDVVQTGEQVGDEGVHVAGEGFVGLAFPPDRGGVPLGLGSGAETAEPVRGQHRHLVVQLLGKTVGRGVLGAGQLFGQPRFDQVRLLPPYRSAVIRR